MECPLCLDPDVFVHDTVACPDGHVFCIACVDRFMTTVIENGQHTVSCLNPDCRLSFTFSALRRAINTNKLTTITNRAQVLVTIISRAQVLATVTNRAQVLATITSRTQALTTITNS